MSSNGQRETNARFIITKTYEIAYALFRLASQIQEKDFAERLRVSGSELLSSSAAGDYAAAARALPVMECLVKFAGDVAIIGTANSDVLLREIYALDAAVAKAKSAAKADELDVAEIFSKPEPARGNSANHNPASNGNPAKQEPANHFAESNPAEPKPAIIEENWQPAPAPESDPEAMIDEGPNNINGMLKSAIRQNTILERIRQSGSCRLKDIQEVLPDCSERTIRYDIQTLLEQNLIERVGNAGPSVYYRARQAA
jgi:hypothetical protein